MAVTLGASTLGANSGTPTFVLDEPIFVSAVTSPPSSCRYAWREKPAVTVIRRTMKRIESTTSRTAEWTCVARAVSSLDNEQPVADVMTK